MLKPGLDVEFRRPQPAPARVARRALLLTALACRADLEGHAADPAAAAIAGQVRGWLEATGIDAEADGEEGAVLAAPLGTLAPAATAVAAGRGEGAAVLAWGIGRFALPAIDVAVEASAVGAALGWLDPDVAAALETARLRPRTDLVLLAEALEVADWRLTAALDGGRAASLVQFAADRTRTAGEAAPLPLGPDGDLKTGAAPAAMAARVRARRRAVLWLLGAAPAYAAVDVGL